MTTTERTFVKGMRVVVRDGPWPEPRIAGHYGKVVRVVTTDRQSLCQVDITGHIDGRPPSRRFTDPLMCALHPDELDVID